MVAVIHSKPLEVKSCLHCGARHYRQKAKCCSHDCTTARAAAQARASRGPLRVAIEDGDYRMMVRELGNRTVRDENGCWIWQGRINSKGYPQGGNKWANTSIYRLVLEVKHGAPLGSQAAHHACGVTSCINPDHLVPVTHAENMAEMLARKSYVTRIAELEEALAEIDPGHPLLNRVPLSTAC